MFVDRDRVSPGLGWENLQSWTCKLQFKTTCVSPSHKPFPVWKRSLRNRGSEGGGLSLNPRVGFVPWVCFWSLRKVYSRSGNRRVSVTDSEEHESPNLWTRPRPSIQLNRSRDRDSLNLLGHKVHNTDPTLSSPLSPDGEETSSKMSSLSGLRTGLTGRRGGSIWGREPRWVPLIIRGGCDVVT